MPSPRRPAREYPIFTHASRERYARIEHRRGKASMAELLAIADRAAAHVARPYADHADILCNENGLPK